MNRQQLRNLWKEKKTGLTFNEFCEKLKVTKQQPIVAYKDKTRLGFRRRNGLL